VPLVRIDVLEGRSPDERAAIGAAVQEAMVETIDVPADDLFQVIAEHDRAGLRYDAGYLGVERDDGVVFIQMTMRRGRTDEQKQALYRRVTELLAERAGVRAGNVLIALTENDLADWSFGDGVAQLLQS
jgi:phenylpyruvate tautomerase PptA (4-oxalocrotonate tautomerase family)